MDYGLTYYYHKWPFRYFDAFVSLREKIEIDTAELVKLVVNVRR